MAQSQARASTRRGASVALRPLGGFVIRIVGHDAVPSLDLGLVEALIGAPQEVVGGFVGPQLRHPERRGHLANAFAAWLNGPLLGLENASDPFDRGHRFAEPRAREDERELLAAETRDLVLPAYVLGEDIGEQPQQPVTD